MITKQSEDTSLQLKLEVADEYVLGLPILVALTVRVATPNQIIRMLPEPTLLSLKNCISVTFARAGLSEELVSHKPKPVVDLNHNPPRLSLHSGVTRRWLVELSEADFSKISEPGHYDIVVAYVAKNAQSESARARIRLRAPSTEESTWLDAHRKELDLVRSWGEWVLEPPPIGEYASPEVIPVAARFHVYLRKLIHDSKPLAEVEIPALENALALARPEAETVRVELTLARGEMEAAQRLEDQLRAKLPGLTWRLESIKKGGGMVRGNRLGGY